jgi:hypothetical protein
VVLGLGVFPVRAEVTLTTRTGAIRIQAGHVLGFQAVHSDGQPHEWDWTIDELSNIGHFTSAQGRHRIAWTAPDTLWDRRLHIRATVRGRAGTPADTGAFEITVTPQPPTARDPDPASRRSRWVAQSQLSNPGLLDAHEALAPRMEPIGPGELPLAPGEDPHQGGPRTLRCLARVGKALVGFPHASSGQGLVQDGTGAPRLIRLHGTLVPGGPELTAEAFPPRTCMLLAAPPGGEGPLVCLLEPPELDEERADLARMDLAGRIEPIGTLRTRGKFEEGDRLEGPLDTVLFGHVLALAQDGKGGILLADSWGTVRRIIDGSQVVHLTGRPHDLGRRWLPQDGTAPEALFRFIWALAPDPATGDLYLGEEDRVRCLTPAGEVRTLVGVGAHPGPGSPPIPSPWARGPHNNELRRMVFGEGRLFILGTRNLLAFDPRTGILTPLAAKEPDPKAPRFGPIAAFTPYLDPAHCAHLDEVVWDLAGGDREIYLVQGHWPPALGPVTDTVGNTLVRINLAGAFRR